MPRRPADASPPPPTPPPRIDLRRILTLRRDLYDALWKPLADDGRVAGDRYRGVVAAICEAIPGVEPEVAADSSADLLGAVATDEALWALACRLAGNVPSLRAGVAARPWCGQREDEWVPLQVLTARHESREFKGGVTKSGCTYTFQALAGSCCPSVISRWWSRPQYSVIARELGFTPPWKKYKFTHAYQLVGLRLWGWVTPELCRGNRPGFEKLAATPSMVEFNHGVLAVRCRLESCPRGFAHDCHRCPVGYRDDEPCRHAVHPANFVVRPCSGCKEEEAWHDPDDPIGRCVDCCHKHRNNRKD